LIANVNRVGDYLQSQLKVLADEEEFISNPRGLGLFCAIDLPNSHARDELRKECVKNHLMILGCGTKSIRFRPPLTTQIEHIDEGLEILKRSYKTAVEKCPMV